jgi:hypothetical protein
MMTKSQETCLHSVHFEPTRMGKCVAEHILISHTNISYSVRDVFLVEKEHHGGERKMNRLFSLVFVMLLSVGIMIGCIDATKE